METNGNATLQELRGQLAAIEADREADDLRRQLLAESFQTGWPWMTSWMPLDYPATAFDPWTAPGAWLPIGGYRGARRGGSDWPVLRTETDSDRLRELARWLAETNRFAVGVLRRLRNFTIRNGYQYHAQIEETLSDTDKPAAHDLAFQVQQAIDEFFKANKWPARQKEIFVRAIRDGEVAVRTFVQADSTTQVRFVEPETIRRPPESKDNWSWGIETEPDDVETTLNYAIFPDLARPVDYETVPAEEIFFLKRNTDSTVKRGMSDFFTGRESFELAQKLIRNLQWGAGNLSAISWIEQYSAAAGAAVADATGKLRDRLQPAQVHPITGKPYNFQMYEPGLVVRVGKGKEFLPPPPANNAAPHVAIVQAGLRSIAQTWDMPEYMISSDASNANFSCHDAQTELLTKRGWLRYDQIAYGDEAATRNSLTGQFEWQAIQAIHIHDYQGEMVRLCGAHDLDVLVTPNHRMYVSRWRSERGEDGKLRKVDLHPFRFVEAGNLQPDSVMPMSCAPKDGIPRELFKIPSTTTHGRYRNYYSRGGTIPMSRFLRFLGWWISEGWTYSKGHPYTVGVSQTASQKAECADIRSAMNELRDAGFNVRENLDKKGVTTWQLTNRALWTWLRNNCGTGSYTKRLPAFVFDLPACQQDELLQALLLGDGAHRPGGSATYFTVSSTLADQVQCLALQCGYISHRSKPMMNGVIPVIVRRTDRRIRVREKHISRVPYSGKVWCVTVPNGLVITRRGGKAIVSGNSTLVAGSPFVLMIETDQEVFKDFFLAIIWFAIARLCESGYFQLGGKAVSFRELKRLLDIHATPPQVALTDKLQNANINEIRLRNGIMSKQTWRAEDGLDDDRERQNMKEEPVEPTTQPGQPPVGGGLGMMPRPPRQQLPGSFRERVERLLQIAEEKAGINQ
jgi:hypothetical protein